MQRGVALLTACSLAISACGGGGRSSSNASPTSSGTPSASRDAGTIPPPPPLNDALATLQANQVSTKNLEALTNPNNLAPGLAALEKLNASAPRSSFDVHAKAAELGKDIDKIFSFVRDEVRYEVYEGVLRGPQGTLMGMAGNSYDKSLLLAALLKQNDYEVRFAQGRLSEEKAKALVAQMFAAFKQATSVPANLPDAVAAAKEFADVLRARLLASVETVRGALVRDNVRLGEAPPVSVKNLIDEAMDHLWIEYRLGDKWVALDASTKGARPGESSAASQQTLGTVPPALFHRVTIRVMAEERASGKATTTEVLRHEATAADLNGASVSLSFKLSPAGDGWSAVPVLQVEDKTITGRVVAGSGLAGGGVENLGRQIFARPGQLPQRGPSEPTAVWTDFDFTYPSGRVATVRRETFDRIGPAARVEKREADAPLLPLDQTEGIPWYLGNTYGFSFCAGPLSRAAMTAKASRNLPALRGALPILSRLQESGRQPSAEEAKQLSASLGPAIPDLSSLLASSFYLYSQKNPVILLTGKQPGAVGFYDATPRLAIVSFEAALAADGKTTVGRTTLDLRRNELRVVADQMSATETIWANIMRGLLDGALEQVLFGDLARIATPSAVPVSAIEVIDRAQQQNVTIRTFTRASVGSAGLPPAAGARLAASLGEGIVAVGPSRAVAIDGMPRTGWWRVDLRTGDTVSVMDTGLHQGVMTEKAFLEAMQKATFKTPSELYYALFAVATYVVMMAVLMVFFYGFLYLLPCWPACGWFHR